MSYYEPDKDENAIVESPNNGSESVIGLWF
jgi:hypothetical protein